MNAPLYRSVPRALASAFECMATRAAVRTPGYSAVVTASTAPGELSASDRFMQALWIIQTAENVLDAVGRAFVTATYTGESEARQGAVDVLTAALMTPRANPELLRAVIERELVIGESWCKSTATIAKECGTSQATAWRLAEKVKVAMAEIGERAHEALKPVFSERGYA